MNAFEQMRYLEKEAQRAAAQDALQKERQDSLFLSILLFLICFFGQ